MHGSRYLRQFVQSTLEGVPVIVAALLVGADGIVGATTAPFAVPALIHYPETLTYSGPINGGEPPNFEAGRYVVRLICEGWSDASIADAADAMLAALSGAVGQIVGTDGTYDIRLDVVSEWPNTSYIETIGGAAVPHRELGDVFAVEIVRT